MREMEHKIESIVELLKQTAVGSCAIALAGAHAKGTADSSSDLDLYLFADSFKSVDERRSLISQIADPDKPSWVSSSAEGAVWGGSMDFYRCGTPVEVNFRTFSQLHKVVEDSLAGHFEIVPATWTSNGYYTFIYLSELNFMRLIWDPCNRLANYQQMVSTYPELLRQSIINTFLARAEVWLDNFHYTSAIGRQDTLFTAPIVLHTLLDMVQVIFALNRFYFTGDKKLEQSLTRMPFCPDCLICNLPFLLNANQSPDGLARQREILRDILNELKQKIQQTT